MDAMKIKVGVFFGGNSVEHEISVISALQAVRAMDREKYDIIPVYITRDNKYYCGEKIEDIENYSNISELLKASQQVILVKGNQRIELYKFPFGMFSNKPYDYIDIAFPIVHGTNVEDGALQGFLQYFGVPVVGSDVLASAVGMDKYVMKVLLKEEGIPVLDGLRINIFEYESDEEAVLDKIEARFSYPVIVKPINLGSSVGIKIGHDRTGLEEAKLLIAENCLVGDDVILIQPSDAAPDSIHQGVAGIIAGQLAEEMRRPVIVLARSREPGVLKGSGRSYGGVNLKALLDCAKDELVTYGGHAEAAGLSVAEENIDSLSRALCRAYRDLGMTVTEETDTMYDIEMEEGDLDRAIAELNRFAPYGQGNPKPVVRLNGYHLSPRYGRHYRVQGDGSTVKLFGKDSSAVGFGMADQYQDSGCPMQIDLIGLLSENVFAGRVEKQLQMLDFRPHQEAEHKSLLTNLLEQRLKTTL